MGWAIDQNMSMETIVFIAMLSVAAGTLSSFMAFSATVFKGLMERGFVES